MIIVCKFFKHNQTIIYGEQNEKQRTVKSVGSTYQKL